jgi:Zn-dependent membrane protease YugP
MFFHPFSFYLWIAPALLLAMWAQHRVHSAYARGKEFPSRFSGAEAARRMLDSAGLQDVQIEPISGELTDHYDPRAKVLRLSEHAYSGRTLSAVGIACHEAGHALQDAAHYPALVVRNMAVPAASFGGGFAFTALILGAMLHMAGLILVGIVLFGVVAVFEIVNLPVEFDASNRAKRQLVELGLISQEELVPVRNVLNAAAWTYVARTLQSVLTVMYYASMFGGGRRDD